MAASQGGYPPQEGYGQQAPPGAGYGTPGTPPPQQQASGPASHHQVGGRKKRAYAGEAFEFGSGANAALGGQLQGGGAYGGYPAQPQAAGYPPTTYGADPNQIAAAGYGQPQAAGVGGYQPPAAGYPAATAPGVAQMTQQFSQMGMADPQQVQQPQGPRVIPLNQLYPTDLLTQPFNAAELDYPPPPIILPPNVRCLCLCCSEVDC